MSGLRIRSTLATPLLLVGLIIMALSRELLGLYVGWEVAGLGVWLGVLPLSTQHSALSTGAKRLRWLAVSLNAPGWVLLAIMLLGLAPAFVPPAGGVARDLPLPVTIAFAGVVLARSGCWPLNGWLREAIMGSGWRGTALLSLYVISAPILLAKALVAAPWDPAGMWVLALLGTLGMVGGAVSAVSLKGGARLVAIASAHAGAAVVGFGLAPGSPVAAAGAVALLLSGALWIVILTGLRGADWLMVAGGWGALLGGSAGAWAIAQGALGLGYGLVAVVLLPGGVLIALAAADFGREQEGIAGRLATRGVWALVAPLAVVATVFTGVYPQAVLEWVVRPTVAAMPGGVGALSQLTGDWGIGLSVHSADVVYAALPATGMALGVALTLAALYWLSLLLGRFADVDAPTEAQPGAPPSLDDILPGAERVGRWLDPVGWVARLGNPGKT